MGWFRNSAEKLNRHGRKKCGRIVKQGTPLGKPHQTTAAFFWTTLAKRSGDSALARRPKLKSGVALRLPPQSKLSRRCALKQVSMREIKSLRAGARIYFPLITVVTGGKPSAFAVRRILPGLVDLTITNTRPL
jgi:hypothetical protein